MKNIALLIKNTFSSNLIGSVIKKNKFFQLNWSHDYYTEIS